MSYQISNRELARKSADNLDLTLLRLLLALYLTKQNWEYILIEGKEVYHLCAHTTCVNTKHWVVHTNGQNVARRNCPGKIINALSTQASRVPGLI